MKNKVLVSAALAGIMAFGCLTGFDSAETAESVLQKCAENSKTNAQATVDMTFSLAASLDVSSYGSMDITMNGTMKEGLVLDPFQMYMTGDITGIYAGSSMDASMEMYMVPEDDGSESIYTGLTYDSAASEDTTEAGSSTQWQHQLISAEEMESFKSIMNTTDFISGQADKFTLASAPVDVNGKECYELTASYSWEDLKTLTSDIINTISESAGEDSDSTAQDLQSSLSVADPYLSGLVVNLTYDIGTDDYKAYKLHMDINGSDWSALNELLPSLLGLVNDDGTAMTESSGSAVTAALNVSDFSIDGTYDYDSAVNITVPEEALATPVTSSNEALTEAESLASEDSASTAQTETAAQSETSAN